MIFNQEVVLGSDPHVWIDVFVFSVSVNPCGLTSVQKYQYLSNLHMVVKHDVYARFSWFSKIEM